MKKVLGLDIGVSSIGWALISELENKKSILGMGSRIIPLSTDDSDEFTKGNAISKNQARTTNRTIRKGLDRYQMRRTYLIDKLESEQMLPDESLIKLNSKELYGLRNKGLNESITLQELGRILLHLNQKRGYKSSRSDANKDKKDTDYVAEVKGRHQLIIENNLTIGQYFYKGLTMNPNTDDWIEFTNTFNLPANLPFRTIQQVFPREAYIEEFEKIWKKQQEYNPKILKDDLKNVFKNEIIFYQRKLKSQKGLVSICEFEGFWTKTKEGKAIFAGPKVAPKSSPLFQIAKIWESINSITLKNASNDSFQFTIESKKAIFEYLNNNEKLSEAELFKILKINKNEGWLGNKQTAKGIQGNLTKSILAKVGLNDELKFELKIEDLEYVDKETGEVIKTKSISPEFEKEPLYVLWHMIYSIPDEDECLIALQNRFHFSKDIAERLSTIDFTKSAFGNKSAKAMRKILPYLMEGYVYSKAMAFAGYNHSNSLTKSENANRQLLDKLNLLQKNSLRQPVVEKILNQVIHQVNTVIDEFGKPDEIRVELARELKQSKDERNDTFSNMNKRERENEVIRKRIIEEYGLRATRINVIKWRLFHEINNTESKLNATCIYCGKPFGLTDAIKGNNIDVEHIIPKSKLFDDSQSNKTLTHRKCNEAKGDYTAYDYMKTKSESEFNEYIARVDNLYKAKIIGRTKRDKLLMAGDKIPQNFIERQLRETQYISKKSKEILSAVCQNVWSTSGSVTEYLRRIWGWDDVLMNLQLPKYRDLGMTEWKEWETNDGQKHKKEIITGWGKRDDHRHHAIDALTIACTEQGFIQRINTLSSDITRKSMYEDLDQSTISKIEKKSLLENYVYQKKPFSTKQIEDEASKILISFKSGKKVATIGKRKIKINGKKTVVQEGIIIPRGALSEQSVYGKIKSGNDFKRPVKYLFENPNLIFKPYIKDLVLERLAMNEGDTKKALSSLKKEPIFLDSEKNIPLEYGTCYKEDIVIKYPVNTITFKDLPFVIDSKVKEILTERLLKFDNKEKEAFKDLDKNPVWFNEEKRIQIRTVRCYTGLNAVEPVKKDKNGKNIGFVKPGNNHHIAIYIDTEGKRQEHICTFWHAVERKKYGIPAIINNPKETWDKILLEKDNYPQSFLEKLPYYDWIIETSLQQNEMFVLGMEKEMAKRFIDIKDLSLLSDNLFRIQKIGSNDYWFRHHLETQLDDSAESKTSKRYYRTKSIGAFFKLNPIKVKIDRIGGVSIII